MHQHLYTGVMSNICIHCDRRIQYNATWQCYETTIGGEIICAGRKPGMYHEVTPLAPEVIRLDRAEQNARLGNSVRQEGIDRCACGCKYWEHDRCIDCGATEPEPPEAD
jgi:hypothetical protein